MANFRFRHIEEIDKDIKTKEVFCVPCNPGGTIISKGSTAIVFPFQHGKEWLAVKKFKQIIPTNKMIRLSKSLLPLKHENICQMKYFSTRPSTLIFQLCQINLGDNMFVSNLKELISIFNDNRYFNLKERISYIKQACYGLSYLHEKNIIYRDLKPSNMLISGSKERVIVKLSDFSEVSCLKNTYISATANHLEGKYITYGWKELLLKSTTC